MTARRFGYATGLVVLAISGLYVFVYLYRWEWVRAQFAAVLFVCIEVALIGAWLAERISALQEEQRRSSRAPAAGPDPELVSRLRSARSATEPANPFAWLTPRLDRTSVFVPVLLGAGVVLSALAWLVERLASGTAGPSVDRSLAKALGAFTLPTTLVAAPPPHDWVLRPQAPGWGGRTGVPRPRSGSIPGPTA